jgi:hypothetical protein
VLLLVAPEEEVEEENQTQVGLVNRNLKTKVMMMMVDFFSDYFLTKFIMFR